MSMFCYQCQETAKNSGCTIRGVCGKTEEVAKLQDLLIYTVQGISDIIVKSKLNVEEIKSINREVLNALFMTITNDNFDDRTIEGKIVKLLQTRDELLSRTKINILNDAITFKVTNRQEMLEKAAAVGVLATENEDIRSLRQMIIYGLKGMAAYAEHALNLGMEDISVYSFIYKALSLTLDESIDSANLISLTLETGEYGVKTMALLDKANTTKYGNPEITSVNIGVRNNPAILISGHDLTDLEQLLEQTKDSGVDVYTHGEMLPAHYYPFFKKYSNFAGNYGNSWWKQLEEFATFNGPVLFTTNCIVPPRSEEIQKRIFTTGASGYPNCKHIMPDENGRKDFSSIIEMAKNLPAPTEIEKGSIIGGFAHNQVIKIKNKEVENVKK